MYVKIKSKRTIFKTNLGTKLLQYTKDNFICHSIFFIYKIYILRHKIVNIGVFYSFLCSYLRNKEL